MKNDSAIYVPIRIERRIFWYKNISSSPTDYPYFDGLSSWVRRTIPISTDYLYALTHIDVIEMGDALLEHLPLDDNNAVFNLCYRICVAYEHKAFIDGLHYGAQLMTEL